MPPIIEAASPEMRINISEPAILVCLITGYPRPSIMWEKDGEVFSINSARIHIFDFNAEAVDSGNFSGINSGFNGSVSFADLLRLGRDPTYCVALSYIPFNHVHS